MINFAMAYFYAAIRAFRVRMAEVETELQRFHTLKEEQNALWTALTLSTFVTTRPFKQA